MLFVEVDGLFVSRQRSLRKMKEEKILDVHEEWKTGGTGESMSLCSLGEGDVWEALELLIRTGKGEEVAREETKETKRTITEKTKS
ncbi:UPF0236 family transposase-like protein [Bacillus smithii]|uniref:UPF0236 family transposase-like protein n=1 Tax=Bacillus smithii TaxID=1479 RepID=UPI0030CA1134